MRKVQVGDIYMWENNYPVYFKEFKNRYYRVLSITKTHVYIQNIRIGGGLNMLIIEFKNDFKYVVPGGVNHERGQKSYHA